MKRIILNNLKNPKRAFAVIKQRLEQYFLSDKKYIENKFIKRIGRDLDLKNPKTFNEKLQWLKLYYRRPELALLVDKFHVREYVANKVGPEILIPLIGYYTNFREIIFDTLPSAFALKATHGSGWNYIVKDKAKLNMKEVLYDLSRFQVTSYYEASKEWAYKNVPPGFVIEELLLDSNGEPPSDYKIFCFDGKPMYIEVDIDRFTKHTRNFYDTEWNLQSFKITYENSEQMLPMPETLKEMLDVARKLSEGLPFARVDLYCLNNKIYFGEITFYPDAGYVEISPEEWEIKFGDLLTLPTN